MSEQGFRERGLLFALPTLTVAVVAFALLTALAERPVRFARLYGGPTRAPVQTFRVEVLERSGGTELPLGSGALRVELTDAQGNRSEWRGTLGEDGTAEVSVRASPDQSSYLARVTEGERELGRSRIALAADAWRRAASRRGGFVTSRAGELEISLAAARGVLAAPFDDELLIEVRAEGQPIAAELELSAEGATLGAQRERTSGLAPARVRITPRDHLVSVDVRASSEGRAPVSARATLPVVPGALDAVVRGGELVIRSPVPRDRAYFAIVSEEQRLAGGSLALVADEHGGASAVCPLPALPAGPAWAIVSSAVDLESPGRVGWPLYASAEPLSTFDAREALLLDGRPQAVARERQRQSRARWVTIGVCGLSLAVSLVLLLGPARREGAKRAVVGALCVALGYALLAVFVYFAGG